jgi:hypothetical protein
MRDCRAKDEQVENPNKQLSCSTQSGMGVGNPRGIHNKNDHYLLTTLRQYACEKKTRTKRNKANNLNSATTHQESKLLEFYCTRRQKFCATLLDGSFS